jgi:hypothetical protein
MGKGKETRDRVARRSFYKGNKNKNNNNGVK